MGGFLQSVSRIAKYRLIRSILRGITDAVREGAENFYNFSKAVGAPFASAMDQVKSASQTMKNQLGSAFGELYQTIVPIILDIIGVLTQLASALSMIWAAFSGKSGWYKATDGANDLADAVGGAGSAAKEAMRYLAPFDELNRLPSESKGGGGGGSAGNALGDLFDFQEFEENSPWAKISGFVRENLEAVDLLVDIFGFSIGLILALSGHFALGAGMMLYFGWKGVTAVQENWGAIKSQMQGTFGELTALIGGALLVIGAVLAFSNASIPLGIGLMVAGAAGLGTSIAVNWNAIKGALEGPLGEATAIISGATLLLGVLLCTAQLWGPGLGLIVAGAAAGATSISVNWNAFVEKVEDIIFNVEKAISIGIAWIEDYIGRGGAQLIINAINSLAWPVEEAVNGIIDLINGLIEEFPGIAAKLGLDGPLEHVDLTIIPNLDPPVGELYNGVVAEWEEKSRNRHAEMETDAVVDEFVDNIPEDMKRMAMAASLNKRMFGGGYTEKSFTTFNSTANWSKYSYGNGWNGKTFSTWDATAKWSKYAYGAGYDGKSFSTWNATAKWLYQSTDSKWAGTTWNSTANWKSQKIDPKWGGTTWNSTANWRGQKIDEKWAGTTWNSTANWKSQRVDPQWAGTVWNSTANWRSQTVDERWGGTTWNSTANWKRQSIDSSWAGTTWNSTANFKYVQDSLTSAQKTINVKAKISGLDPQSQLSYASGGVIKSNGDSAPITRFDSGGLASGSQLFWARESGPELVGTLGNRSAVMNNDQIVASVAYGVQRAIAGIRFSLVGMPATGGGNMEEAMYNAFVRAFNDTDQDNPIMLDGDVLYSKMVDRNRAATYRMGSNPMMSLA